MGYSGRYHAASLAAIFLALAVGIVIGAGFGNDVVTEGTKDLEKSLKSDVVEARARADSLQAGLNREREFGQRVYAPLVGDLLNGDRVAVVALASLLDEVSGDVETALGPAGAGVATVAVVREPPDLAGLAGELGKTKFRRLARDRDTLRAFGEQVGRSLVTNGALFKQVRDTLLSRFSGRIGGIDSVVVVRQNPAGLTSDEQDTVGSLEGGLLDGLVKAGVPVVGVELSDADPSSIGVFASHGLASVDSVDLTSGRLALAYALAGARGKFGVKDTADRLLPALTRAGRGPGGG